MSQAVAAAAALLCVCFREIESIVLSSDFRTVHVLEQKKAFL